MKEPVMIECLGCKKVIPQKSRIHKYCVQCNGIMQRLKAKEKRDKEFKNERL
jgi:Zn finger protein HypA/HybF involved in hydrogenase expression